MTPSEFTTAREALGMKQSEIAALLLVDERSIQRYERNIAPKGKPEKGERAVPGSIAILMELFQRSPATIRQVRTIIEGKL